MADDIEPGSLGDIARIQAKARGDATALAFEGRAVSYAAFDRHTNQVANGLIAMGVKPGDRVTYLGKNSDLYFEALFGATKAGAVMAPINWRLAPPEVRYIIGDAAAKVLFVGPEFIEEARRLLPELGTIEKVVAMEGAVGEWPDFQAWRDAQSDTDPKLPIQYEDVALQLYTSGTTGHPKGAMLSHRAMLQPRILQKRANDEWNRWGDGEVSLVAMPVFHIGGTGWGIMGLYNGAKGVVAREFDPNTVLDFIENDRISKMFMVPAAMQIVVRQPQGPRGRLFVPEVHDVRRLADPARPPEGVHGGVRLRLRADVRHDRDQRHHRRPAARGSRSGGHSAHARGRQGPARRRDRDLGRRGQGPGVRTRSARSPPARPPT